MPPLCVLELWIFLKEMEIRFCASNAHSILNRARPVFSLGLSNRSFPCWRNIYVSSWDSDSVRVDCVHSAPCLPSKGMDLQLSSFLATPSRRHCPMGGRRCFCYTQTSLRASFRMHVGADMLHFTKMCSELFFFKKKKKERKKEKSQCGQKASKWSSASKSRMEETGKRGVGYSTLSRRARQEYNEGESNGRESKIEHHIRRERRVE